MRDIDIKTLRLLVAVCDLRNIKHAAAQEHIEPSAISKRIAQLEASLGTPLLIRNRRGVEPTPAGLALLEHARTMLFTMDRIESDIAAFSGGVRGHVRLVASASAIAEALLDDVASFMRQESNRNVKVDI
jgi:DNA-binding transcriptional LysR family regulator